MMGSFDHDRFARGEGFRGGQHRNNWYQGKDPGGCLMLVLVLLIGLAWMP